ncbi:MAG: 1-acyl-sn-glycerol-3-phosphate acyltransferase, partial [Bacteroidales bacterium]|nr:1-acyl-sn-glycerol-3-phosphate acyltransferase [Bacteroidales bacterium]
RELMKRAGESLIKSSRLTVDSDELDRSISYIYNNLPIFMEREDYARLDSAVTPRAIEGMVKGALSLLLSPAGGAFAPHFSRDPLNIGTRFLSIYDSLRMGMRFRMVDDYIFSQDNSALLYIITPQSGSGESGRNRELASTLGNLKVEFAKLAPDVKISSMGGPVVGVYNAATIKKDTFVTLTIAIFIIAALFAFTFRDIRSTLPLLLPAAFGALFALAFLSGRDGVSAIAIGAGAAVLGIALSYSIHIVSHLRHVCSIEQLLKDLAYPLTVGSFTTIGAFAGLQFTQSTLLRDFGLFSALTLIGTTLFSLIYLPHMLKIKEVHSVGRINLWLERFSSQEFEKRRWLIFAIVALFIAGVVMSPKVRFDSDMLKLSIEPKEHIYTSGRFDSLFGGDESRVLLLSTGESFDMAARSYRVSDSLINAYIKEGVVERSASLSALLPPLQLQRERLQTWSEFWGGGKREVVVSSLKESAEKYGLNSESFVGFYDMITRDYHSSQIDEQDYRHLPSAIQEWIEGDSSSVMLVSQLFIKEEMKEKVYGELALYKEIVVVDRAHFSSLWADGIKSDFNLILVISSLLVFVTLLISYGRVELALLAFLPMFVSWVIILGLMALFGIPFNIVNILLATFIFGIGDDFSIFVLDGLSSEYERGAKTLSSHKLAIFFSTLTVIIGMGAMLFAQHPALQSVALVSVLGMCTVWIVAYTIQPIIYRFLITTPANGGQTPVTLSGVVLMLLTFSVFTLGCLLLGVFIVILAFVPLKRSVKRLFFRKVLRAVVFIPVRLSPTVRIFRENPFCEDFSKPAVIVVNHQSFIDILMMLSLYPKIVMMTNSWVWNSPFFGHIVRYAGFLYHKDGVDNHIEAIKERVAEGYSVLIFPEGTRSADMTIHRFHKGAFKIANELSLDILPVVIYGNGNLLSKRQPFYIKPGTIGYRILERVKFTESGTLCEYRALCKHVNTIMREEYSKLRERFDTPENDFFYFATMANFIFKGPVLEWYMRVKINMERRYSTFHKLIPLDARVTDLGCGYGPLCFMLKLTSPGRVVTGIDYDREKIELAKSCYTKGISFTEGDITIAPIPESDVIILCDTLHYLLPESQRAVLKRVVESTADGGFIIIRDGDSENLKKHKVTKLSEWFSINLLNFNKSAQSPCFIGKSEILSTAAELGCSVEVSNNDSYTSNTTYILRPENRSLR